MYFIFVDSRIGALFFNQLGLSYWFYSMAVQAGMSGGTSSSTVFNVAGTRVGVLVLPPARSGAAMMPLSATTSYSDSDVGID